MSHKKIGRKKKRNTRGKRYSSFLIIIFSMINTIFWNLRGISNTSTISRLRQLIVNNQVVFLAVFEPMVDNSKITSF